MKKTAFALFASVLLSTAAFAGPKIFIRYTSLDFDKHAQGIQVNVYDDDFVLPDGYDQYDMGIKFKLFPGETFELTAKAIEGGDGVPTCSQHETKVTGKESGTRTVRIPVKAEIGLDDGSACEYTVKLSNGKSATVAFYALGT